MRGTIYKRDSDNKWVGSVELGKDSSGKRKRKVVYGDTEKEVQGKINTLLFELQTGEYIPPSKSTFIDFLNDYYNICLPRWQPTTASLYKMYIDVHFEPYFKKMKLSDIKPITLDKFYNYKLNNIEHRQLTMSINSILKLNTFLKAAFNYALKNGEIKTNPCNSVMLQKKEKFVPSVYTEDQFLELLKVVKNTDDEIPIILGAGCGMRRGEIWGLKWKNIDFEKNTISIENTIVRFDKHIEKAPKNESSKRTFIVPDYVICKLREYKKMNNFGDDDSVITKWKVQVYSCRFRNLLKSNNLPPIRFHDLRHYNAVIMLKNGVSDKVAAERLGHSDIQTLRNVYQHVLEEMDSSAANKINSMFK